MFFIIIFGLLIVFFLSFFFSNFFSLFGIFVVGNIFFLFILSVLIYNYLIILKYLSVFFISFDYYLVNINYLIIEWSFLIDALTIIMLFVIVFVSYLVYIYSFSYMRYDSQIIRFLFLLNLFSFFMILLVTSGNFIQLFIGWEGVGLCSYLLINFWFTRLSANKASLKAMLMNRIGDICLLISFGFIYTIFYTFDFLIITALIDVYKYVYFFFFGYYFHGYTLISFFLLLGAFGKSAQLGFHTWLPDAMEGPTPVSALIHAATMVTAGVFIIIRSFFFFNYSFFSLFFLVFFGSFTALFGSLVAFFQYDIKKIIAYSTCSQLGYMFVACGLIKYDLSLFHLFNHAFFKALLFLGSGVIIHGLSDEQDIRKMGFLYQFFPYVYISFLIGSYALMGLPFMSGFYSKDLILETSLSYLTFYYFYIYLILIFAAFFTNLYSLKLIYLVFLNKLKMPFMIYKNIVFESNFILISLLFLNSLSIYSGYLFKDIFFGFGSNFFIFSFSSIIYSLNLYYSYEFLKTVLKLFPLIFFIFSFLFIYYYYYYFKLKYLFYFLNFKNLFFNLFKFLFFFFNKKMYFDLIYNNYFILKIMKFSYNIIYKKLDKNLLELFGVKGLNYFVYNLGFFFNLFFSNFFTSYLLILIFGFFFFLFYLEQITLFMFFYLFFFFFEKKINLK